MSFSGDIIGLARTRFPATDQVAQRQKREILRHWMSLIQDPQAFAENTYQEGEAEELTDLKIARAQLQVAAQGGGGGGIGPAGPSGPPGPPGPPGSGNLSVITSPGQMEPHPVSWLLGDDSSMGMLGNEVAAWPEHGALGGVWSSTPGTRPVLLPAAFDGRSAVQFTISGAAAIQRPSDFVWLTTTFGSPPRAGTVAVLMRCTSDGSELLQSLGGFGYSIRIKLFTTPAPHKYSAALVVAGVPALVQDGCCEKGSGEWALVWFVRAADQFYLYEGPGIYRGQAPTSLGISFGKIGPGDFDLAELLVWNEAISPKSMNELFWNYFKPRFPSVPYGY